MGIERRSAAGALALLGLAGCSGDGPLVPAAQRLPETAGGPFALVDQDGRTVTDRDFQGRAMLVYFGYTSCASLCGLSLSTLADALDAVDPAAERTALVFVSLDPRRDTPAVLGGYVGLFHERMQGLTGTPEQVDAAARAFKVYYTVGDSGETPFYGIDHTRWSYLIGRDGRLVQAFGPFDPPATIADRLDAYLDG
jgi:protein SCO1/2